MNAQQQESSETHFVITGNDIHYQAWRRHHRDIINCKRVTNRRQGRRHLGYCYSWNEEVAAICEIVALNGGTVVHSHGEKV